MGVGVSANENPILKNLVSVSLQSPNIIMIIDGEHDTGFLYQSIKNIWKGEIQRIVRRNFAWEFYLIGRPFINPTINFFNRSVLARQTGNVRNLFCKLISCLESNKFCLKGSCYIGKLYRRTTLYFLKPIQKIQENDEDVTENEQIAEKTNVLCFAIRVRNLLQFTPSSENKGNEIIDYSGTSTNYLIPLTWLHNEFHSQIDAEYVEDKNLLEIAFRGSPFGTNKFEEKNTAYRVIIGLIRFYNSINYMLMGTLSLKGNAKNDTFLFRKIINSNEKKLNNNTKNFFLMSLEERNRIRLFECPNSCIQIIESCLASGQLKSCSPSYMGCSEMVLNSNPFYAENLKLAETQLLLIEFVEKLWKKVGWKCAGAVQVSQMAEDKVTIVFENSEGETYDESRKFIGICTLKSDLIRAFNISQRLNLLIIQALDLQWSKEIQDNGQIFPKNLSPDSNCYWYKLRGRPWTCRDESFESRQGLQLFLYLIEQFARDGWTLLGSFDVGARLNDDNELHIYSECSEMMIFTSTETDRRKAATIYDAQEQLQQQENNEKTIENAQQKNP